MSEISARIASLSPLKRAYLAIAELQSKLDSMERDRREPIAIIGAACRFPGARNLDEFRQLLRDGTDATSEIGSDRWDVDAHYDPDPEAPGKMYTRRGGFLQGVELFDAQFFGISPREAVSMDPQQRLLLEVSWEALEHAGQAPDRLSGTPTAVFVGMSHSDYARLALRSGDLGLIDAYAGLGNALSAAAGRVSYSLGLQGPSMVVDTACSSSLVAIHLACASLRNGECGMALAAGVNLILSPEGTITCCKARMLAADGRCKTFDAAADGYVRGEGCGVVVLKRLREAVGDGDTILAVIRGSAVNQDGRSAGLTAPNGPAQEAVIRQALAVASVDPAEVSYVEAHGTGTPLGDPIEVHALAALLSKGREGKPPLALGSVKTNIGHLEAAAGVAGLIKVVLALENEEIPAHLHFHEPNPYIEWARLPIVIPTSPTPWPRGVGPRIAGVSSFGFSGTNAHVVLEEAPLRPPVEPGAERPAHLLCLSAKSEAALQRLAERFEHHLATQPGETIGDVCFTANTGRSHFAYRLAVLAETREQARERLAAFVGGTSADGTFSGRTEHASAAKVAFLFTGQGAQYAGMGRRLFETQPVFRQTLERCEEILRPHLERPLLSVLYPPSGAESLLDETAYTQPALFAFEYALAELWRGWGIRADALLGHSVGEYVAACVAGVFSLEDGLRLVAERGRLMQGLPREGAMAAVFAGAERVAAALAPHAGQVSIAAVNGPENTVISGAAEAVATVVGSLKAHGIESRPLTVSHAFHSPLMTPILDAFEEAVRGIACASPRIALVSNLTGGLIEADEVLGATYWRRHVREPVQFAAGMRALHQRGCEVFLEIGPSPTLLAMGRRCVPKDYGTWLPSVRRGRDDWRQMLESLGALYVRGADVEWTGVDQGYPRRKISLPTYPFQRQRYWIDAPALAKASPDAPPVPTVHPLLGRRVASALEEIQFESRVGTTSPGFLNDHRLNGTAVFPAAAFFEMAMAAAAEAFGPAHHSLEEVSIEEPLVVPDEGFRTVQLILVPPAGAVASFQIFSREGGARDDAPGWTRHVSGTVRVGHGGRPPASPDVLSREGVQARCDRRVSGEEFYPNVWARGLELGPSFRGIERLWLGQGEALGSIRLPAALAPESDVYHVHPALLDACFQVAAAAAIGTTTADLYVPVGVGDFWLHARPATRMWCHAHAAQARSADGKPPGAATVDLRVFDDAGQLVAEVGGLRFKHVPFGVASPRAGLYTIDWRRRPRPETPTAGQGGRWLIFADGSGLATALAQRLQDNGERCLLIGPGQGYAATDERHCTIDPDQPEHFRRLLERALEDVECPCRGVVFLWGVDAPSSETVTVSTLDRAQALGCRSVLYLVQAILGAGARVPPRLWLVTRGAQPGSGGIAMEQTPLWGLGRVIALEHPELRCTEVDLELGGRGDESLGLFHEIWCADQEDQVALRGGIRHVARLVHGHPTTSEYEMRAEIPAGRPFRVEISSRGILDNLVLRAGTRRAPGPGEVEIEVQAAGLNFRDVLNALGTYPGPAGPLGLECSGRIVALGAGVTGFETGEEVLAMAAGAFASSVTVPAEAVLSKPRGLTFEDAATIPVAFLTVQYGLHHLAGMKAGDRVLIHAAAGGVGLAAVQLARRAGAEIFATAGTKEKRAFLTSLGVEHVMSSRSLDFATEVMERTDGRGVDIVLNSLAGEYIPRSLSVLARGGRFVEIGKTGLWDEGQVARFRPDVSYFAFELREVGQENPGLLRSMLDGLLKEMTAGHLEPLPRQVFPIDRVVDAFRHMAQARHIGKVVLSFGGSAAEPLHAIRPDGTYLITGGLGALGLEVARWMVRRGARHLVLVGRHDPSSDAGDEIRKLEGAGASVVVRRADVAHEDQVARVLAEIEVSMPPLRGLVHAAGVLDDGMLVRQTWKRFATVMAPKVPGAWILHALTEKMPLDFFVLFSSAAAVLGSPGQANYAAANAFLDGLAHHRRMRGLPATSIDWGPWADAGMAMKPGGSAARWWSTSMPGLSPTQGVEALEQLLRGGPPQVTVLPARWEQMAGRFAGAEASPLLSDLLGELPTRSEQAARGEVATALSMAAPQDRRSILLAHIRGQLVATLRLDPATPIEPRRKLLDMGMDSLMAVELRNRLQGSLGRSLPATVGFEYPTLESLTDYLATELLSGEPAEPRPEVDEPDDGDAAMLADIRQLSEAELLASLAEELSDIVKEE